jgi:oligopeptide transport system permease protein
MTVAALQDLPQSQGVWVQAWTRLRTNRVGMASLVVTLGFILLMVLAQLGLVASHWQEEVGTPFAPPHFIGAITDSSESSAVESIEGPNVDISDVDPLAPYYQEWNERAAQFTATESIKSDTLLFGADQQGRDVIDKVIKGAQVSITVGLAAALFATLMGTLLGAIAGYIGGWVDDVLEWFYNVFTAIPYILLVFALAAVLKAGPYAAALGNSVWTVVIILGLVGWTGIYRLVRAEYIKHRARDYVRAAEAIGASHASRMFTHILPNISHVVLVQLSLHVVGFIKAEVILSFLGLGVPIDVVSWGTMLAESQAELVQGKWWQLAAATAMMAVFVTAFALLTDALRDALDPKLR